MKYTSSINTQNILFHLLSHITDAPFQLIGWENDYANTSKKMFISFRLSHSISIFSLAEYLSALWENSSGTSTP